MSLAQIVIKRPIVTVLIVWAFAGIVHATIERTKPPPPPPPPPPK